MSEFKEYEELEASLGQKYLKQLSPDAFELSSDAFYAGQQSQQAKIDELQARVGRGLKIAEDLMGEMQNYKLGESLENILKGNKDEN